jgi:hypothetical protein
MGDLVKRRTIVEALIAEGPKLGFKHSGWKITDNYTRVSGRERIAKWDEGEPESELIRKAVKKKLDEVFSKLEDVPSILRPLVADAAM